MDSRQGLHRFASLYLHQLLLGLHHPYVDAAQRQEAYANAYPVFAVIDLVKSTSVRYIGSSRQFASKSSG